MNDTEKKTTTEGAERPAIPDSVLFLGSSGLFLLRHWRSLL